MDEAAARVKIRYGMPPKGLRELESRADQVAAEKVQGHRRGRLRSRQPTAPGRRATARQGQRPARGMDQVQRGPVAARDRRGSRTGRIHVDRHPGHAHPRGGVRAAAAHGRRARRDAWSARRKPIESISRAVRRARAGLKDPQRPIGAFHVPWAPPASARRCWRGRWPDFMFGSEDSLIRIDMSEYMERHAVIAAGRRAAGLRGLRRRRPVDGSREAPLVRCDPAGRDRESAPRSLQHPAATDG